MFSWSVRLLLWRVRSNGVLVVGLVCVAGKALLYHTHINKDSSFDQHIFLLVRNTPHTRIASATTPQHHRITPVVNMPPKKAKVSAAQKAANKAAGIEKRKATMAAKAAQNLRNNPAFQAVLARANARFGSEEEHARSGTASEAQQSGGEHEEEDEPITPVTPNMAGKRPAPADGSSAAPSRKRPHTVAGTGSPVVPPAREQDYVENDEDAYDPEAAGEEGDAEASFEAEAPPSSRKGKGKARAGTSTAASKNAERLRRAALAGPLRAPAASKSAAAHAEFQQILDRSLDVDLDDPSVINNTRLVWKVCERCASHLDQGKHTSHLRGASAAVLTWSIGHTCSDGSDDPYFPRRCARCAKGNGKCVWLRPSSHSGLYEALNNAIRAWLAWEQSARGGDEEETLRTQVAFHELNDQFLSNLRSFQGSRRQRIGAQATPHKRSGAAGGPSGDLDNVVDQMQRMVAVGESLVDYASMVRGASAIYT